MRGWSGEVGGERSEVRGRGDGGTRSEVRGRRGEVGGARSEVRDRRGKHAF